MEQPLTPSSGGLPTAPSEYAKWKECFLRKPDGVAILNQFPPKIVVCETIYLDIVYGLHLHGMYSTIDVLKKRVVVMFRGSDPTRLREMYAARLAYPNVSLHTAIRSLVYLDALLGTVSIPGPSTMRLLGPPLVAMLNAEDTICLAMRVVESLTSCRYVRDMSRTLQPLFNWCAVAPSSTQETAAMVLRLARRYARMLPYDSLVGMLRNAKRPRYYLAVLGLVSDTTTPKTDMNVIMEIVCGLPHVMIFREMTQTEQGIWMKHFKALAIAARPLGLCATQVRQLLLTFTPRVKPTFFSMLDSLLVFSESKDFYTNLLKDPIAPVFMNEFVEFLEWKQHL
jgi:hypothetical protein